MTVIDTTAAGQAADDAVESGNTGETGYAELAARFAPVFARIAEGALDRDLARELPFEPEALGSFQAVSPGPEEEVEVRERLGRIAAAMDDVLTPHQRRVLVALAVNGVPIDVLADRLSTTRGALYKTLHDARAKLRAHLEETS